MVKITTQTCITISVMQISATEMVVVAEAVAESGAITSCNTMPYKGLSCRGKNHYRFV
jgi:hypothetical protein